MNLDAQNFKKKDFNPVNYLKSKLRNCLNRQRECAAEFRGTNQVLNRYTH
jgi:hypothetical protein